MLPEITPSNLCSVLGVDRLPPSDFSIAPPPPPPTPTSNLENLSKIKEQEFDPNRYESHIKLYCRKIAINIGIYDDKSFATTNKTIAINNKFLNIILKQSIPI